MAMLGITVKPQSAANEWHNKSLNVEKLFIERFCQKTKYVKQEKKKKISNEMVSSVFQFKSTVRRFVFMHYIVAFIPYFSVCFMLNRLFDLMEKIFAFHFYSVLFKMVWKEKMVPASRETVLV